MTRDFTNSTVNYAGYELVVKKLRDLGPQTTAQLGRLLGWSRAKAADAVRDGRKHKLIVPDEINRRPHSKRVYHAAIVPGWPNPAPDTVMR